MNQAFKLPELYITPEHECSYLPERRASTLYINPYARVDNQLYAHLSRKGFRRSGEHLYMPYCRNCKACTPLRIPVEKIRLNRNQSRVWKKNKDLTLHSSPARFRQDEFDLYCRYLADRHPFSNMNNPTPDDYMSFLSSSWSDTIFYRLQFENQLLGVAVIDRLEDGLSCVYTFYDTDHARRSLGKFAILLAINEAKVLSLPWVYLGYWIKDCNKMRYKNEFKPVEYYYDQQWCETEPQG